jgi:arsenate reductase
MTDVCMFHNPRCSKSRQTLQLLQQQGIEPALRLYLQDPPDQQELVQLLDKLGITARDLMRRSEVIYKEQGLADPSLSDAELIDAMVRYPKLIERPIVVVGERAVLGRPPENVLSLL